MKKETFTIDEISTIEEIIERRIKFLNSNNNSSIRQIDNIKKVLEKINNRKLVFSEQESVALALLTKEMISEFHSNYSADSLNLFTNLNPDIQSKMNEIDLFLELLCHLKKEYIETTIYYDLKFRYKNIQNMVDKLKKSETILLSNRINPYKIGFVFRLIEVITFDFKRTFTIEEKTFTIIKDYSQLRKEFDEELSRKDALELISKCDTNETYPSENIEFLKEHLR